MTAGFRRPQNVRWKDGTRALYEAHTCTGDPTVEANWTYRGSFSGGRAVINGAGSRRNSWAKAARSRRWGLLARR